jgi:Bacterial SH3 domain
VEESSMNARILTRLLGASAALALLVPVTVAPAAAQDWYRGPQNYGYGPDEGYPPAQAYQDYTAPPEYGPPQEYESESQNYGPPGYVLPPRDEPAPEDQAQGYYPPRQYAPSYRYEPGYGAGQPDETYVPDETYGPSSGRSLYRSPEVPPVGRGYTGSSAAPEGSGQGYSEGEWAYPQARTEHYYAPSQSQTWSERLVAAVDVNLRDGPSDGAPVRTVLPAGTPVRITGSTESGWVQVDSQFGSGWVYSRYLAPV